MCNSEGSKRLLSCAGLPESLLYPYTPLHQHAYVKKKKSSCKNGIFPAKNIGIFLPEHVDSRGSGLSAYPCCLTSLSSSHMA